MSRIIFISGAGLSAPSGLATFRGHDGLWNNENVNTVCNIRTFADNRGKVFEFYNARRAQLPQVQPNAAHVAIAQLQLQYGLHRVVHATQNVDDLNERAGGTVLHLHGSLRKIVCQSCLAEWDVHYASVSAQDPCPYCLGVKTTKPAVVFFGEQAPAYAVLDRLLGTITREDICVTVGSSGRVLSAYQLRDRMPFLPHTIWCNLDPDPSVKYSQTLLGDVQETVPKVCAFASQRLDETNHTTEGLTTNAGVC